MNKINVDQNQKNKLLEMCNDLCTEFDSVEITTSKGETYVKFVGKENNIIHWFQVCMLELPSRISQISNSEYPMETQWHIYEIMSKKMLAIHPLYKNAKTHPIDYLYEQYQKTSKL